MLAGMRYFFVFKSCNTSLMGVPPVPNFHCGRLWPQPLLPVFDVQRDNASVILAEVFNGIKPAATKWPMSRLMQMKGGSAFHRLGKFLGPVKLVRLASLCVVVHADANLELLWHSLSIFCAMLGLEEAVMTWVPSILAMWNPRSISSSVMSFLKL
jgi:hypothetical protein